MNFLLNEQLPVPIVRDTIPLGLPLGTETKMVLEP